MTIKEVYEKYKHVDDIQFTRQIFIENYKGQLTLLCDLWLAIKNDQEEKR